MSYYLFRIDYQHGDYSYTEHYVIEAKDECEAENRVQDGLVLWYGDQVTGGIQPNEYGQFDNIDNIYSGHVLYEVSHDFVTQIPLEMKLFNFGVKP